MKTIQENTVQGIRLALSQYSPKLVNDLESIMKNCTFTPPGTSRRGASIYGAFTAPAHNPQFEALNIQQALLEIDRMPNSIDFRFNEMTVHALLNFWQQFIS